MSQLNQKTSPLFLSFQLMLTLCFLASSAFSQTHIVPTSASTTAGEFGAGTAIENIFDQATPGSDPLVDSYTNTCSVAGPMAYISSFGVTTGTLTVGIPVSSIDAIHVWNGWSTACELDHSINNITLDIYSGGMLLGTETLDIPAPDGSGFGFVVPFGSAYDAVDEVVIDVNTIHGGNEIGIIELGFRPIDCSGLTTTVSATDICIGETVTLEASSETGGTVTWDGGVVDGVAFEPPVGTTTYTATSDSDLDCDFSVDITVHELPDVTATASDDVICLGEEVSVSGGGATDYTWDPAVDDGVAFTPADAGTTTYTVTGTDDFGCSNTATVDVTVAPAPDAAIEFVVAGLSSEDGGTGGCIASEVQFNDISTIADPETIVSWDWDFGDGDGSSDENPTHLYDAPGTYTVTLTVTSENGCTATIDIEIVMTEGLSLELIFNNPTCFGFNDGSVTINVLGGVGELIFTITDEDGNVLNEDNSNTANSLPEGWYYITVDDDSECSGDVSVFLDDPDEMEVDITVVDPACYGEASGWARVDEVFNATGDEDGLSFFWAPNTFGDEGLGVDSAWALTAGDYTLTVNDENGCSKVIDFNVSQPDSLFLSEFGFEPAHCRLFGYQSGNGVVFGAAGGGTADYDYTWRDLTTDDTYPNTTWGGLNPGDYELTVTDENGCTLIRTITLDSISPIANFNVISDELNADLQGTAPVTAVFENTSTNFHNEFDPFSDTTFFWSLNHPDAGWDVTDSYFYQPDTVYGPKGQSYTVDVCLIAFNKNGCADTLCKELTIYEAFDIVDINIFTPNGDGANDIFTFEFQAASIAEFECVIVNRWGVVMAELNDITDGWDGNDLGGSPAADGTYFYVYKATTDNSTKLEGQGTIQLVRGQ